jgi:hypothetical protein
LIILKLLHSEEIPNINMENRIDRKNDESRYQPKIHSDRIKTLYEIKQATGKPMTVLLDQAIRALAENYSVEYLIEQESLGEETKEEETWEEYREYIEHLDQLNYQKCLVELEKIKQHEQGRKTD